MSIKLYTFIYSLQTKFLNKKRKKKKLEVAYNVYRERACFSTKEVNVESRIFSRKRLEFLLCLPQETFHYYRLFFNDELRILLHSFCFLLLLTRPLRLILSKDVSRKFLVVELEHLVNHVSYLVAS